MWLDVLNITAPLFMLIGLGYFSVRINLFQQAELQGTAKFVMRIGLPALIFNSIAGQPLNQVFNPAYVAGYGSASLAVFAIGYLVSRHIRKESGSATAVNALGVSLSNTGFIGYPLLAMTLGSSEAGQYLAMNILIENVMILPLFFIIADAAQQSGKNWRENLLGIIKNLAKNPIILAISISILIALLQLPIPTTIAKTANLLSTAAAPVALFVIGGGLAGLKLQGKLPDLIGIALGKTVLFPALVTLGLWLSDASAQTIFAGALLSCVPMASMYPLLAMQYGHQQRGSAAMLVTTCFSFFSISLVLLIGKANGF